MLRITINPNAKSALEYFTKTLKSEDYFFGNNEPLSQSNLELLRKNEVNITKAKNEKVRK